MTMTKKEIFSKIAFYVILATLFLICATTVVLLAAGYKIDFKNRKITQTGIIIVKTLDKDYQIYIDEKFIEKEEAVVRNLTPGFYEVQIKKEGYQTFTENFYLNPGEAKIINNIVLFLESPIVEEFSEQIEIPFEELADTGNLLMSDRELFVNNSFLTRFESRIQDASWYPNDRFVGITVDNRFSILDIDTLNEFYLFDKKSNTPVIFINSGKTVIFESEGNTFSAQIR